MLVLLLLALTADERAAHFLRTCDRVVPTLDCSAYVAGFVDSARAHQYATGKALQRDVAVTATCLPAKLETDDARRIAVVAMKERKPGEPPYLTIPYALAKAYPCKEK